MHSYRHSSVLAGIPQADVHRWHCAPGALERLLPPDQAVRIVRGATVSEGSEVVLSVPMGPLRRTWVARHREVQFPEGFIDEQVRGPFASWIHQHRFEKVIDDAGEGTRLVDDITYQPPGGPLAGVVGQVVLRRLVRTFAWRHERTRRDLERHRAFATAPRRTVAISGASGLVGAELVPFLTTGGHRVRPLVRHGASVDAIGWDPLRGRVDERALAGCDAVVHLAGAPVARRWTPAVMEDIRSSRISGTRTLAEAIARHASTIKTFIVASGVNIYPSGEAELDESAAPTGSGFLADVAREWEAAAEPARAAGVRVVHLRIGMVVSARGGGLARMLTPASFGLGGPLAGGEQYLSWIDVDDLVGLIHFALHNEQLTGAINATAPEALRQHHFAEILGRVLMRPAFVPTPAFALRAAFGQMADELLFASVRVVPTAAQRAGFRFCSPDLVTALRFALAR